MIKRNIWDPEIFPTKSNRVKIAKMIKNLTLMTLKKAHKWRHSLSSSVRDNVATESKQRLHKRIKKGEACDAKFRSDKNYIITTAIQHSSLMRKK